MNLELLSNAIFSPKYFISNVMLFNVKAFILAQLIE